MTNVIKQVVKDTQYGTQTIKMVVKEGERGPQGLPGEPGITASIQAGNAYSVDAGQAPSVVNTGTDSAAVFDFYIPKGEKGDNGQDGYIQYTAGAGINITNDNVIEATGSAKAEWGDIEGTLSNQTDLQTALASKQDKLTAGTAITIQNNTISASVPTRTSGLINDGSNGGSTYVEASQLASVATSGSYADLSNKPTIPTVNNSTITFTNNGSTVGYFTTNAATGKTIALTAPVVTMTSTDPGEGSTLAANNFIAVYEP